MSPPHPCIDVFLNIFLTLRLHILFSSLSNQQFSFLPRHQLDAFLHFSTKNQFMDGHTMRVFVVQFQPNDDNVFVSGGWDDTVQVSI